MKRQGENCGPANPATAGMRPDVPTAAWCGEDVDSANPTVSSVSSAPAAALSEK